MWLQGCWEAFRAAVAVAAAWLRHSMPRPLYVAHTCVRMAGSWSSVCRSSSRGSHTPGCTRQPSREQLRSSTSAIMQQPEFTTERKGGMVIIFFTLAHTLAPVLVLLVPPTPALMTSKHRMFFRAHTDTPPAVACMQPSNTSAQHTLQASLKLTGRQLRPNAVQQLVCDAQLVPGATCWQAVTSSTSRAPSTCPAGRNSAMHPTSAAGGRVAVGTGKQRRAAVGWRAEHACRRPAACRVVCAVPSCELSSACLLEEAICSGLSCICIIKQPPWLPSLARGRHAQQQDSQHEAHTPCVCEDTNRSSPSDCRHQVAVAGTNRCSLTVTRSQ